MTRARKYRARAARIRGLAVVAIVAMVLSCGGRLDRNTAKDPASEVDSEGATWVFVTPPLDEVRVAALQILVNVEGLLGVVDLLRESYDLDLGDEDVLEDLGLDPAKTLVALGLDSGACLIMGARSGEPLDETLQRVGETSGLRIEQRLASEGPLTRVYDEDRCVVALLRLDGLVLLAYSPEGTADAAVAQVALRHLGGEGMPAPDGRFLFEWRGGASVQGPIDVAGWPGPLAGVGHWINALQARIKTLRLTFAAGIDGIDWDLEIVPVAAPEAAPPAPKKGVLDWKDAVPEDAVLTVQIRTDAGETLGDLLGGKGLYIAGLLAGEILAETHVPGIREALAGMDAVVGFVLLGADPRAPVREIVAPGSVLQALNAVHLGLIVQGTPPDGILEMIPIEDGPAPGGWRARVISADAPRAVEFCKAKDDRSLCLGVLAGTDRLMVVTGKGETDRVARVWAGTAPPLSSALFVGKADGDLVLTLKMKRLVRDMRSKGVPPFYLRMVNSFLEIQAVRAPSDAGTRIEGEVLLR